MSKKRMMDGWECGVCFEPIDNRPHVRIAVDVAVEEDIGGVSSLMEDEVLILAVFHSPCISETKDDEGLEDDVPYLREARALTKALGSIKTKKPTSKLKSSGPSHLRVLNGGTR